MLDAEGVLNRRRSFSDCPTGSAAAGCSSLNTNQITSNFSAQLDKLVSTPTFILSCTKLLRSAYLGDIYSIHRPVYMPLNGIILLFRGIEKSDVFCEYIVFGRIPFYFWWNSILFLVEFHFVSGGIPFCFR